MSSRLLRPPIRYFALAMEKHGTVFRTPSLTVLKAQPDIVVYASWTLTKDLLSLAMSRDNRNRRWLCEQARTVNSFVMRLNVKILHCCARPYLTVWKNQKMFWKPYAVTAQCIDTGAIIHIEAFPSARDCNTRQIQDVWPDRTACKDMAVQAAVPPCLTPGCNADVWGDLKLCPACELRFSL